MLNTIEISAGRISTHDGGLLVRGQKCVRVGREVGNAVGNAGKIKFFLFAAIVTGVHAAARVITARHDCVVNVGQSASTNVTGSFEIETGKRSETEERSGRRAGGRAG